MVSGRALIQVAGLVGRGHAAIDHLAGWVRDVEVAAAQASDVDADLAGLLRAGEELLYRELIPATPGEVLTAPRLGEAVSEQDAANMLLPAITGPARYLLSWAWEGQGSAQVIALAYRLGGDGGQRAEQLVSFASRLRPIPHTLRILVHGAPGIVGWDHYLRPLPPGEDWPTATDVRLDGMGLAKILVQLPAVRLALIDGLVIRLDACQAGTKLPRDVPPLGQQLADTLGAWLAASNLAMFWDGAPVVVKAPDAFVLAHGDGTTTLVRRPNGRAGPGVWEPADKQTYEQFTSRPATRLPEDWMDPPLPGPPLSGRVTRLLPELVVGELSTVEPPPDGLLATDAPGPDGDRHIPPATIDGDALAGAFDPDEPGQPEPGHHRG